MYTLPFANQKNVTNFVWKQRQLGIGDFMPCLHIFVVFGIGLLNLVISFGGILACEQALVWEHTRERQRANSKAK